MLKTVGRAGGGDGYGAGVAAGLELRQILQQQKRKKRQTKVLPIMAPRVVKIQWLMGTSLANSLASLVMVSSSRRIELPGDLCSEFVDGCGDHFVLRLLEKLPQCPGSV
jgi:hypothetical protein